MNTLEPNYHLIVPVPLTYILPPIPCLEVVSKKKRVLMYPMNIIRSCDIQASGTQTMNIIKSCDIQGSGTQTIISVLS